MKYEIVTIEGMPQTDDQGNVMVEFTYNGKTLHQYIFMAPTKGEFEASCQIAYDAFKAEIDALPPVVIPSYISEL